MTKEEPNELTEMTDKELLLEINRVFKYLKDNQEPLGEEFQKVLDDHFWELLMTD